MIDLSRRFDQLYTENADPWNFANSPYEKAKYRSTIDALPRSHYRLGVDAGCSIGIFTLMLSSYCDRVIGLDVSAIALSHARHRCASKPNVSFIKANLPTDWPNMKADLLVLSEVLYFLDNQSIERLAERIAKHWAPNGDCVLVNYRGPTNEPLQGDEAANCFMTALSNHTSLSTLSSQSTGNYRIEVIRHVISA